MKILFVSMDNFPVSGACTSIIKNIIESDEFNESDIETYVLGCDLNEVHNSSYIYNGIKTSSVFDWTRASRSSIRKIYRRNVFKRTFFIFMKMLDKIIRKIFIRHFFSVFAKRIYFKKIKEMIKKEEIDVVLPICGDFAIAAALLTIKKRFKNQKILGYFVDPCSTNETLDKRSFLFRRKFEDKVFSSFNKTFVTPIIFSEQELFNNLYLNNLIPVEFPCVKRMNYHHEKESNNILFIYSGRLYAGRKPDYLFKLFESFYKNENDISLIFVGTNSNELIDNKNCSYLKCLGYLPIKEARNIISCADFLLLIGNGVSNQVPSKLFEYISFGLPIINIYKNENDPSLIYLKKYPLALNLFEYSPFSYNLELLKKFVFENKSKKIDFERIRDIFIESTPSYFCKKLFSLL